MQGIISFDGTLDGSIAGGGGGGTTPVINADATVDSLSGDPTCTVSRTGTDEMPTFHFAFSGIVGEEGPEGSAGVGVPTGGSTGDVLRKDSTTDYDTYWDTLTALDIPYDNTSSGMTATDVQAAITELKSNLTQLNGLTVYRNLTPQTSYASFNDGSNLPLISLTTSIDPIQDLHGYDNPWAGGAGKNKLNPEVGRASTYYNSQGQALGNPSWSVYLAKVEGLNTVTISGIDKPDSGTYFVWLSGKNVISDVVGVIGNHKNYTALTVPNDAKYIGMSFINNSSSTSYDLGTAQVESGSTVTAYEPYSNICPISGHAEANVVVSPTTDAEDGTTYNVEFTDGSNPLTVYGGTLDVVSGELTLTDEYIASYNGETLPATWISDRDVYAEGTTPTTGAEVVYELATPQTYQLTPTQVNSLLGQNYIFSDTGNITNVKYIGVLNFS